MKKAKNTLRLGGVLIMAVFTACGSAGEQSTQSEEQSRSSQPVQIRQSAHSRSEPAENKDIKITIGNFSFTAQTADSRAAEEFFDMLPLELDMRDLNGNEKYFYFDHGLTADAIATGSVQAGYIMLYGDSCLVIFYESFSTYYSYTPIAKIENTQDLARAAGGGKVKVIIEKAE